MFSKYGRGSANELAREYCRRSDFFQMYLHADDVMFRYDVSHVAAYVECEAWRQFVGSLEPGTVVHRRAMDLVGSAPRLGG